MSPRKLSAPLPPFPARTSMSTLSNTAMSSSMSIYQRVAFRLTMRSEERARCGREEKIEIRSSFLSQGIVIVVGAWIVGKARTRVQQRP